MTEIKRREFLKALGTTAVTLSIPGIAALSSGGRQGASSKKPNIILILVDDMGWTVPLDGKNPDGYEGLKNSKLLCPQNAQTQSKL